MQEPTFKNWSRNANIYRLRLAGETFAAIASQSGISTNRARQIFCRLERMRKHPSREGQSLDEFLASYSNPIEPTEADMIGVEIIKAQKRLHRASKITVQREKSLLIAQQNERAAEEVLSNLEAALRRAVGTED